MRYAIIHEFSATLRRMCAAAHTADLDDQLQLGSRRPTRAFDAQTRTLAAAAAVEDFSRALLIQPDCTCALIGRGNAYFGIQEYEYAFVDYDQVIQLNHASHAAAIAYNNRGTIHANAQRSTPAIRDFSMAIEIAPASYATAYGNRSIAATKIGDYSQAIADAETALMIAPRSVDLLHQRAQIAFGISDYDTAVDYYTRSLAINASDPYAYLYRGYANRSRGRQSEAVADFRRAVEIAPYLENESLRRFLKSRERGSGCLWIVVLVILAFVVIAAVQ